MPGSRSFVASRRRAESRKSISAEALSAQLRAHVNAIARAGHSPLFVALVRAAADDAEAGGIVAAAFEGVTTLPGSGPALRLVAALHFLVLTGRAPELARHFPSVGGTSSHLEAWPAARKAMVAEFDELRSLLKRPVQTNEPGRAAALYGALLYLAERYRLPVRLLEVGASAGLNLQVDRFDYRVHGRSTGAKGSPLMFDEPWRGKPVRDLFAARRALEVTDRPGCDKDPIDPRDDFGRLRLIAYVWPDEPARLAQLSAALEVARRSPALVARASAPDWLAAELVNRRAGELVVVWQSVVRPYVSDAEAQQLDVVVRSAGASATSEQPLAFVQLESSGEALGLDLVLRSWPRGERQTLASCPIHGLPVTWAIRLQ